MRDDKMLLAVLALALAVLGVAMLVRPSEPAGEPAPMLAAAPPVHVLYSSGVPRCVCVPARNGCYTAKHCFQALPRGRRFSFADGTVVWRYSLDPYRDLAHVPYGANPAQLLGEPRDGEDGVWRGIRSGVGRVVSAARPFGPYDFADMHIYIQRQPYDVWTVGVESIPSVRHAADPDVIYPGDSGGGFWVLRPEGPVLVGILSMSDGWGANTVRVP